MSRSGIARALDAYDRLFFERRPSDVLSLCRIGLGVATVVKLTGLFGIAARLITHSFSVGVPYHWFTRREWHFDVLSLPLLPWLPVPSWEDYATINAVCLLLGVAFLLGIGARVVGPVLGLLLLYLQLFDVTVFKHHHFTLAVAVLLVGLSPCADRFSVDSYVRGRSGSTQRSVLPVRLVQILLATIYLFATVAKLNDSWFLGVMASWPARTGRGAALMLSGAPYAIVYIAPSIALLLLEAFLTFGLLWPRTRRVAVALGISLHVGLELFLDVSSYSHTMLALYAVLLSPQTRNWLVRFDASRPLSRAIARAVRLLDWGARFDVVSGCATGRFGVDVLTRDGSIMHSDAAALWAIARRTPLTQPVATIAALLPSSSAARRAVADDDGAR